MHLVVGDRAAHEAKGTRDDREAVRVPVGKQEADRDRNRRLEDHRAGDVPERKRVLAVPHPKERVGLLGQLGRKRGEDEREDQRLDPDVLSDVEELLDEEMRAADDRGQAGNELDHDQVELRIVAIRRAVEDERPDVVQLLDVPAFAQGPAYVGGV